MNTYTFIITKNTRKLRLDKFLIQKFPDLSRNRIQKLVKDGNVHISKKVIKKSCFVLREGMQIELSIPEAKEFLLKPENISLDIVFENNDLLVINKPAGMIVHPSDTGHERGTVVNAVLYYLGDNLSGIGVYKRPGIVHRLDKNTSGLLMIAKNDTMHQYLSEIIKKRKITKKYLALVKGKLKPNKGVIDAPIGRNVKDRKKMAVIGSVHTRDAVTHYKVLDHFTATTSSGFVDMSFLEVRIITGRTHQIRVHLDAISHPIIGDAVYGDKKFNKIFSQKIKLNRPFLHAAELSFLLPDKKKLYLKSPLPIELKGIIDIFKLSD